MKNRYTITAVCLNKHNRPICVGENSYKKTHPLQAYFAKKVGHPQRIYIHAEIQALIRSGDNQVHVMCVTREDKLGNSLPSKPCPVCYEAIRAYGVKYIYYMDENHIFITEKL